MFIDYHVHSSYSDDSQYPMEQVVRDAIDLGLTEICFTDHVDYGVKRDWDDPCGIVYRKGGPGEPAQMPLANIDYLRYLEEIAHLREKYARYISVRTGAEFGMQRHTVAEYESLFSKYPFDFIILSVHQVDDLEFWNQDFQQGRSQERYNLDYYDEILYLVRAYRNYSVLGHLDLISRYDLAGAFPFEKRRPVLTEILKTVIKDGKGIEVNTSCFRYGLKELTPSRQILELYLSLGGTVLTIGSDSHKRSHLGEHIPETLVVLKDIGFEKICTYRQMQPYFFDL